jgi:hypothetical protein
VQLVLLRTSLDKQLFSVKLTLVETGDIGTVATRIWGEVLLNCVITRFDTQKKKAFETYGLPAVNNTDFAPDIFDPIIYSTYKVSVL